MNSLKENEYLKKILAGEIDGVKVIHVDFDDSAYEMNSSKPAKFNKNTGLVTGPIYSLKKRGTVDNPMTCGCILIEDTSTMTIYYESYYQATSGLSFIHMNKRDGGLYIPIVDGINNVFVYIQANWSDPNSNNRHLDTIFEYKKYQYGILLTMIDNFSPSSIDLLDVQIIVYN